MLADSAMRLAITLESQTRPADAEPLVRETLAIREKQYPAGDYHIAKTRSVLGGLLTAQGRYDEAEPLLLSAYADLIAHPPPEKEAERTPETLNRIVELYQKWPKPEKLAEWRAKLPATRPAMTTNPATTATARPVTQRAKTCRHSVRALRLC
jgi:hypothetical protein